MKAQKPILHARDHMAGGADPIPGLITSGGGLGPFDLYVYSLPDLIGYWRLGEGASPWLDTSPTPYGDAHLSKVVYGAHHMNDDVPGALPAEQDDGAVEFTATAFTQGDYLVPAVTGRFQFTSPSAGYTVACWLKMNSDSGAGSSSLIAGTYSPFNGGWALEVGGGVTIQHTRVPTGGGGTGVVGPGVALDEWIFVATTYGAGGYQMFYNGGLVATAAGGTVVPNFGLKVGAMATGGPVYGSLNGSVDELAIWNRVLTIDEIQGMYARADPAALSEPAGKVLLADGSGGTEWGYIGTSSLDDDAVTTPKIAAAAVTPAKIADGGEGQMLKTVAGDVVWALPTVKVNY